MDEKYRQYLKSEQWKTIRIAKLEEVGYQCENCHSGRYLQVHHLTYQNIFNEKLSDLQVLCDNCHKEVHNIGELEYER